MAGNGLEQAVSEEHEGVAGSQLRADLGEGGGGLPTDDQCRLADPLDRAVALEQQRMGVVAGCEGHVRTCAGWEDYGDHGVKLGRSG